MDDDPRPDLTSLIDVIFMLVIFFVMTMNFASPMLDVTLPKASKSESHSTRASLGLTVRADGSIWDGRQQIDKDSLDEWMRQKPDEMLVLYVDEKAPFEGFVEVVNSAKSVRSGRFAIATVKADK